MSAKASKKVIGTCRAILGAIYPISAILMGVGTYLVFYSELPDMITVHFDITRVPTTSLAKPVFGLLMSSLLVLSAAACTSVAISKKSCPLGDYRTIVSYGGFLSAISACLMVGSVIIHRGLSNWQDATGPGWWLLVVVLAGFAGRSLAMYLASKIHERASTSA
jgi:drug/metabolite transporter (DMT)-like permease